MSEAGHNGGEALAELIRERLAGLRPARLDLIDDSDRHAGHAGAGAGRHYRLLIVSSAFIGQSTLARHRMINGSLADLLRSRIHALSIRALTPEEAATVAVAH